MDRRIATYVRTIDEGRFTSPADLARHFGVSERTIRSWAARVNDELAGSAVVECVHGAYRIEIHNCSEFEKALAQAGRTERDAASKEDRVSLLLDCLLSQVDWMTIERLSRILYVSPRTISHDLKDCETILASYDLKLQRRPHYGIRVTGNEMSKRICLASHSIDGIADSLGGDDALGCILSSIDEAIEREGYPISSVARQNLLIHISIAILRMKGGSYIQEPVGDRDWDEDAEEWRVASAIAGNLGRRFGVEFPLWEIEYIALHLQARKNISRDSEASPSIVPDEAWQLASQMIEMVRNTYSVDFRTDLELRINLACHLAPLLTRLKWRLRLDNPILGEIISRFPLAYSMATEACAVLKKSGGCFPSKDEIGYIALSFALALDRMRNGSGKKRVLLACASGVGSSKLLEHRFRQQFAESIASIEVCDVARVQSMDLANIDCVFTTVPIAEPLPVPVFLVSVFLDQADIDLVDSALVGMGNSNFAVVPRLFFPRLQGASQEDVISTLCEALAQVDGLDVEALKEQVWEREQFATTYFGNGVAMPHPMAPMGNHTLVSIALLERPIDWGGKPCQVVALVSITKHAKRNLDSLYAGLMRLIGDRDAMALLLRERTFSCLQEIMEERN